MIEYDKFQKSLKHLELQYENHRRRGPDDYENELMREAVIESVIQRFEVCYDCLWKVLKRYLVEELGVPEVPNSPKPILRLGAENKLFSSPIDRWLQYADARTDTSHDYSEEKAQVSIDLMGDFVDDAIDLFQTLSGETWE